TENGSGLLKSKVNIEQAKKPMKIEIVQKFPENLSGFYLGTRSSSEADWQYSKLHQDGYASYSNSYPSDTLNTMRAVAVASISYTFTINTTTFGDEIAVFGEPVASSTLNTINGVKSMNFTTDLPYLDLKFDSNGKYVYNTDLIINTCIEAERLGSLFSDANVQTVLTFLTNSSTNIESLRVVGNSTAFAKQEVSEEGGGAGDQYTHTIYFKDYPTPSKSGRLATYSFTLKTRNVSLDEFPATFTIKTILIDNSIPIAYASECTLNREDVLSYFEAVSPTTGSGAVDVGSNLVMKYIAHDIASLSVRYIYSGLENSILMPGSFTLDAENHLITFSPDQPWPTTQTIIASATASCCGEHGANGIKTTSFKFLTGELGSGSVVIGSTTYDPVTVEMIEPDPITGVAVDSQVVLQFSDTVEWLDSYKSLLHLSSGTISVPIGTTTFDVSGKTLTFASENGLCYNSSYSVTLDGFTDTTNHKIVSLASFSFSTRDGVHGQASIIASDGSIIDGKLITNPIFVIDFGKDITQSDYINENRINQAFNAIKVYQNDSLLNSSKVAKNWITPYQYVQLTFTSPLEASSTYKIVMGKGVLDFENLEIEPFDPYIFTTMSDVTAELAVPASPIDVA
ncbi:MAG: Ig-like domain-containing protein, partial [Candidatus Riflebacteria bacterium]|nr:Ig-like domain-containing protein [Candidatus Riflebacteria bacterium]